MAIDFELSGQGPSVAETMTLADMQDAAVECGFTKPNVASTKTHAQRANLYGFFKVLGVTSVSGFKKRFLNEKLPCPYPSMTPLIAEKVRTTTDVHSIAHATHHRTTKTFLSFSFSPQLTEK